MNASFLDSGCGSMQPKFRSGAYVQALCLAMLLGPASLARTAAEEAPGIEKQIEQQKAENEALRAKIAKFEQVLKTDVCSNPEAAKLLEEDKAEPPPAATKTP